MGILPTTKCAISDVHFKQCDQTTGSAASLGVGWTVLRGETLSEHTGGPVVSEATVLLIPRGGS